MSRFLLDSNVSRSRSRWIGACKAAHVAAAVCYHVSKECFATHQNMDDATGVPHSLLGSQRSLWEECELVINSSMARLGVFALLRTLPMGICWSLFFKQSAHETFVDGEGGMNREVRAVDFTCGVKLRHCRIFLLEYVNNLATRSEKFRTRRLHQKNRCVRRWRKPHGEARRRGLRRFAYHHNQNK